MKKFATMAISIALIGTMVAGGSLAYLTDQKGEVNVMTVGNVKVELNELQRTDDFTKLEKFDQGRVAMPIVGSYTDNKDEKFNLTKNESYIDKIVYATNTGKSDAYMRILVALPAWAGDSSNANNNNLHWNYPGDTTSAKIQAAIKEQYGVTFDVDANKYEHYDLELADEDVTIDGADYMVWAFTFKNPISAGESTNIVLTGLYLDSRVDYDADINKYLDINGDPIEDFDGNIYVPVYVQAVQAAGFKDVNKDVNIDDKAEYALNEAFGDDAEEWFEEVKAPTLVADAEELADAVANGEDVVLLTNNITMSNGEFVTIPENASVVIDLNGKTLTGGKQIANETKSVYAIENKGTLTLKNGTVSSRGIGNYGTLIVEDGVYNAVDNNGGAAIWNYEGSNVTVNGGTFTAADTNTTPGAQAMWVASGATAVVNGGTFKSEADWTYAIISEGNLTINDANIIGEHGAIAADEGTLIINGGTYDITASGHTIYTSNAKVTINDGTFKHSQANATAEGNCVVYATSDVVINGGTFDSENAAFAYNTHKTNITVNGGTFMNSATNVYKDGTLDDFVAEGHTATTNTDGSVTVK